MAAAIVKPVRLTGPSALRVGLSFPRDPLLATRTAFDTWGPFVILAEGLPFSKHARALMLGIPLVLTAGAAFNAEILTDPETWRGVSVLPGGPKNSAARRMIAGLPRLTGEQHAHYRKLIGSPLRRTSVEALYAAIAGIADAEVASWRTGETFDLWGAVGRIMQRAAVELLFGGNDEQTRAIIERAGRMMELKWGPGAFALPINLPFTTYGQIVREAEKLERDILQWAAAKRGHPDDRDLASIIVNNPDAAGCAPDDAALVAHIASLFALSSEGSQSALTWTLLLLTQHPRIAATLCDELRSRLGSATPALDRAGELPYLDAVVKESMRILPPVPLQIRVAQRDTTIAGHGLPQRTRVMINTFLTNRMPDLYPDGDTFRPERWFDITPNAFEYPVFSAGPHLCPGYWFGTAAVKIGLAAILTRHGLDLPPGTRVDYRAQPTLRPRRRVEVRLRRVEDNTGAVTALAGTIRNLVSLPL
ncbi:MAG: cytochrome P450 [Xanthobacteraceae bacterium]